MRRQIAPVLAQEFSVVCADLRGYGRSGCLQSAEDHEPYSKRAIAGDMVAVMRQLALTGSASQAMTEGVEWPTAWRSIIPRAWSASPYSM